MQGSLNKNTILPTRSIDPLIRRRLHISGRVQGVGFRPFVYRLAKKMEIGGSVWNDAAGVVVEAQGTARELDQFVAALRTDAPAAAAVREIIEKEIAPCPNEGRFEIQHSLLATTPTAEVTADLATCEACLAEIRDPANARRYRYALTNCTNCGPRFSIIRSIPYDRPRTTMAPFAMCQPCRDEYEDPADRRFHAQPTACRDCGPQLELLDPKGSPIAGEPIESAVRRLADGKIVAIKGIGGFHLAVRADDQAAVLRLRELKHRPAKPFAVMCPSLQAARRLVRLTPRGEKLIASSAAPIVLARRNPKAAVADAVAPGNHRLGVMLAYTPLHHLIFDEARKFGIESLVMTSGNDLDEPLAFANDDAIDRLGDLCDAILRHNRPIQRAVDDSVLIDTASAPIFVRRSRGFAPAPIVLPEACDATPGWAVGAELKCAVATYRNCQVILSQHLGNLTQSRTFDAFKRTISDLCELFGIVPHWIAHDLHPGYLSTQHARHLAEQQGLPLIAVQHHHAHAASVLAEHGLTGPALAVVCDGTGYGTDGSIWGGELLAVKLTDFRRIGRMRPMPLPGGDAAAKQPWRSALALLFLAHGRDFVKLPICRQLASDPQVQFVSQMLLTGTNCIQSSSTGRIFDAVAALLGLCRENRFDAEAPATLEAAAAQCKRLSHNLDDSYGLSVVEGLIEIDLSPLVRKIVRRAQLGVPADDLAMLFHEALAAAWESAVAKAAQSTGLNTIALSGGVFCNELFGDLLETRLQRRGLRVLRHRQIPPNDGGIAFGQAAVAAARISKGLYKP
jgi:hydrogenase maturation protein HypF